MIIYFIAFLMIFGLLSAIFALSYKKGQSDLKNEIAKKELSIKQKQIDIANSPSDRADDVIEWLSNDGK